MASLPPRQASQPRRTSPEQSSTSQTQPQQSPSPVRTRSEDSSTLLLNTAEESTSSDQTQPAQSTPADDDDDSNVKKCWICFSDSTEDTPTTSPWRSPCPCALVAHEECLLDWIADMEAPGARRGGRSASAPKIECPQCKSEIKLSRPRNLVVDAVRSLERVAGAQVTPAALAVLSSVVYQSSMLWGVQSIYAVFGSDDGWRILRPVLLNRVRPPVDFDGTPEATGKYILAVAVDHLVHWRLYVGLPLITPMLILSRTTLADSILPVMPILFFATQAPSPQDSFELGAWPPSASLAFSILPYIRSAYNIFYRKVLLPKEKQWLREIQPRVNQDAANGANGEGNGGADEGEQNMGPLAPREDDDNVFEVRIDGGIWEDWDDDTDDEEEAAAEAQRQVDAAIARDLAAQGGQQQNNNNVEANPQPQAPPQDQPQPQQPANAQPQQQNNQQQQRPPAPAGGGAGGGERRLSFSPTAIAETVLGALIFPAIAGTSGELLKLLLPRAWTTAPTFPLYGAGGRAIGSRRVTTGLLQEKWGRSIVGGCLFVVLKDAVVLYVRWKMAMMHRERRVLDHTGRRGRA